MRNEATKRRSDDRRATPEMIFPEEDTKHYSLPTSVPERVYGNFQFCLTRKLGFHAKLGFLFWVQSEEILYNQLRVLSRIIIQKMGKMLM